MHRALKDNGVPTRLEVAPREGHVWIELRHQLFKANIELEWFERYVIGAAATSGKSRQLKYRISSRNSVRSATVVLIELFGDVADLSPQRQHDRPRQIFGAVFFVAGLLGLFDEVNRSPWVTQAQRRARAADPVQPRAPRRRQRHRLPLLPHLGRGFVVCRHSADQDLHELPLADLLRQPVPRAGPRELPDRSRRSSGRASTICPTSSTSTTAST